ncbi:VCBS repeat-containing protein [Ruania alkalisoli]|uniref:VCBS repeat-containing protein n=1 Tax=Ruania alkalisoli TaxID=2779775 RepID=A0A7M1SQF6_9MICO|nr:FG-GAP-like repeat-containing protein [Ruania alkalisoli]QOR69780.1 VCBS repeat-containing protein [Ruania alkalisoli]
MHSPKSRRIAPIVLLSSVAFIVQGAVADIAYAQPTAEAAETDENSGADTPTAQDVTAPVSDDAHEVEPGVTLVDFGNEGTRSMMQSQTAPGPSHGGAEIGEPSETPQSEHHQGVVASAPVPELAVVGVSWDVSTPEDLTVDFRTLTDGSWSEWEELEIDNELAEEALTSRQGTEPLAVADAQEIEVRLTTAAPTPQGAQLSVIDPGTSSADTAPVTASTMTAPTNARPTIYSRAQWGADESFRTWVPETGRVMGIDIHHTAGLNGYSADEVPSIIRGIYAYHAQEWGRDWGDIGYNVLVDRFGRAWEGRYGGIDQAIIGAHATGLNANMAGISLIGNYDQVEVPTVAFEMVARVAAWKMTIHGTTPHGTTSFNGTTWDRVIGHRDAKATTCPGRYMYTRLDELKDRIAGFQGSFAGRELNRDLDGDGAADLVVREGDQVSLLSTAPTPGWQTDRIGHGWDPDRTTIAGDWDADGYVDIMLRTPEGDLLMYRGRADGTLSAGIRVGWGWSDFNLLIGGDDWNGDGDLDMLGRRMDGTLWLYASNGQGSFARGVQVGRGWNGMETISMAGDFVGGHPTILGRHGSNGHLYAYSSNGVGTITGTTVVSSSWSSMEATTGVSDLTGDGAVDLLAISPRGELLAYPGTGTGAVRPPELLATGWSGTTMIMDVGTVPSGRLFLRLATSGVLYRSVYSANSDRYGEFTDTGIDLSRDDLDVTPVGDWDGDGRQDLVVRTADGDLRLHRGLDGGRFDPVGIRIGVGWTSFDVIVGAGDWRGDGRPGIVGYDGEDGQLWLYTGDGSGGFLPRVPLGYTSGGIDLLANVGQWGGPGAPGLLARRSPGSDLYYYAGTGAGLVHPPVLAGERWHAFHSIVGINDVTEDQNADVIAVMNTGEVYLYPGNGRGGFLPGRQVGSVPASAVVS